jgi:hypothetical protein
MAARYLQVVEKVYVDYFGIVVLRKEAYGSGDKQLRTVKQWVLGEDQRRRFIDWGSGAGHCGKRETGRAAGLFAKYPN